MVTVWGAPEPYSSYPLSCFLTNWCAGAHMDGASMGSMDDTLDMEFPQNCSMYKLNELESFERIEDLGLYPVSGDYFYITLKFSSSTCPGTYTSLFSGSQESNFGYFTSFSSYALTTTGLHTSIEFWSTLTKQHVKAITFSLLIMLVDVMGLAVERCETIGGDGLMTLPNQDALQKMITAKEAVFKVSGFYFVGYTRPDENSDWEWTLPHLEFGDNPVSKMSGNILDGPGLYSVIDLRSNVNAVLSVRT
ncbi:hypothetical protein L5515_015838 [Caenorhabditis briggsae]|uniref:Uncharacterized protein n=1 Tax=Caenorhabditis briggsae TaxID=6238 RepID=A0AAE9EFZ5_CAEBR|nr:hypothetical protein L5515_015838 [Caenorhabditis briggsae]